MTADFCPSFNFKGKRALVTGGSRGLGAAISQMLAASGAHVFMNYREDENSAQRTSQAISADGGSVSLIRANLLVPEEIRDMFGQISGSGGLDFLIHSAALGSFKPLVEVRPNQWDLTLNTNARALLLCVRQALPLMEGRDGRVVSLSSLGSQRYVPSYGAIGVAKAALESMTRYLAVELAPRRINVNAVSAGLVETESIRRHPDYDRLRSEALARSPRKRLPEPEGVARPVLFLCSPLADWISGQTLVVDGGASLPL